MRHIRTMLLGAALITGATTFASAQAVLPVQWGWGQRDNDDRQAFREGFRHGQWDAQHNRGFNPRNNRWRERDDREAYRSGYERGFQSIGYRDRDHDRDHDGDRDRGYGGGGYGGGNGGYGGYGGYGLNAARQNGYQDGINDGAKDRRTGHSNRPTQGDNYKHADRGYIPTYGNKDYYKQAYREAYQNAYEQGYNGGVYQRR
jgi:hypothetical protein